MLLQKRTDVVGNLVAVQMFNQQLFGTSCQIRSTRNLNAVFVVIAQRTRRFGDAVRIIGTLIEPQMVTLHFLFQTCHIHPDEGVVVP